jgi:hypothetical protein
LGCEPGVKAVAARGAGPAEDPGSHARGGGGCPRGARELASLS